MNSQHNPDLDKIKELLKKVGALAERGIEGEKEAAKGKLKILLDKYHLTLSELTKNRKTKREFNLKNTGDCATILLHCILDTDPKAKVWITPSLRKTTTWLNPEQFINVTEKFKYYWKLYEIQKKSFLHAFLIKNNLGLAPTDDCSKTMSEKEFHDLLRMEAALEKGNFMPTNRMIEISIPENIWQ